MHKLLDRSVLYVKQFFDGKIMARLSVPVSETLSTTPWEMDSAGSYFK